MDFAYFKGCVILNYSLEKVIQYYAQMKNEKLHGNFKYVQENRDYVTPPHISIT